MSEWMCRCGHNRSFHRSEWRKFAGGWDTSCMSSKYGMSGRDRCRCGEFVAEGDDSKKEEQE